LRFYQRVIPAEEPNGNKESSMPFADPVAKLDPHVTRQINCRRFTCLQGDFILTKRTDRGVADELLESLVVILEPGWDIPAHLFVGCKQEAGPKSIAGVHRHNRRPASHERGDSDNGPSQPASPENAHAFTGDAGYKRSRKFRLSRTFLLRFREKISL
jgi:hypothetical protein